MVACRLVKKYRLLLLVIILLALGLRLHNITYHSIWFDEAISVHWAKQSVPRILEVGFTLVEDRLPPLYYLKLKGWTALFGFSETSIRALSVMFGVLLIPVTADIAARLFNRRIALVSAVLIALNPFLIWYSQEARMYAPAVFFGTLSVWAFVRLSELTSDHSSSAPMRRTPKQLLFALLFILSTVAGLYNHLYAGFLLPALGLWLIIAYPRRWRLWLLFGVCGLVISLAFSPVALAIWRFSGESQPGDPFAGLFQRAWDLLHAFTLWKAPLPEWLTIVIPGLVLLFALFAFLPARSNPPANGPNDRPTKSPWSISSNELSLLQTSPLPRPTLLVALLLVMPFTIATLLLFRNYLAFFGERYFIVMVPWLLMLAAAGTHRLGQWVDSWVYRWQQAHSPLNSDLSSSSRTSAKPLRFVTRFSSLFALTLIAVTALPIPGLWSPHTSKEAWRQSVAFLRQYANAADSILIHPDWVRFPFQYYFGGPGQTYAAFSTVTESTNLDGRLQGVVGDHPVVWLIQSHTDAPDPARRVENWFAARYPLATEVYPPGITLKAYVPRYRLDALPAEATRVDIQFENGMRLVGFQADATAAATDNMFHPPSGWVHVVLYWTAVRPIAEDAAPYVQLVGPAGVWGVSLETSHDALDFFPPSHWVDSTRPAAGLSQTIIRHDLDVNLNPATPPGIYHLVVGLRNHQQQYPLAEVEIR